MAILYDSYFFLLPSAPTTISHLDTALQNLADQISQDILCILGSTGTSIWTDATTLITHSEDHRGSWSDSVSTCPVARTTTMVVGMIYDPATRLEYLNSTETVKQSSQVVTHLCTSHSGHRPSATLPPPVTLRFRSSRNSSRSIHVQPDTSSNPEYWERNTSD